MARALAVILILPALPLLFGSLVELVRRSRCPW